MFLIAFYQRMQATLNGNESDPGDAIPTLSRSHPRRTLTRSAALDAFELDTPPGDEDTLAELIEAAKTKGAWIDAWRLLYVLDMISEMPELDCSPAQLSILNAEDMSDWLPSWFQLGTVAIRDTPSPEPEADQDSESDQPKSSRSVSLDTLLSRCLC
jgi:hypothetical protein